MRCLCQPATIHCFCNSKKQSPPCWNRVRESSAYPHHGQRVVMGQRLMQPASDVFLGWGTSEATNKQFYVRQLRDAKIKPAVETFDSEMLLGYAKACGWVVARAHAKAGDSARISGYLGSSDQFDNAVGDFSVAYANQAERDMPRSRMPFARARSRSPWKRDRRKPAALKLRGLATSWIDVERQKPRDMMARRTATVSLSQADGPTYMFPGVPSAGDKREAMPGRAIRCRRQSAPRASSF